MDFSAGSVSLSLVNNKTTRVEYCTGSTSMLALHVTSLLTKQLHQQIRTVYTRHASGDLTGAAHIYHSQSTLTLQVDILF